MENACITFLNKNLQYLKGVGEKRLKSLKKLGCSNYLDILFHLPHSYIDRSRPQKLSSCKIGEVATVVTKVVSHNILGRRNSNKRILEVFTQSDDGVLKILYFNAYPNTKSQYPVNAEIIVSGKLEFSEKDGYQIIHPDKVATIDKINMVCKIEGVYPLTQGIWQNYLGALAARVMENMPQDFDPLPNNIISAFGLMGWFDAIYNLHFPQKLDYEVIKRARSRLAFDEIVAHIIVMRIIKGNSSNPSTHLMPQNYKANNPLIDNCISLLPFELTDGQKRVVSEIQYDIDQPTPCRRLIQGDVGSGKTIVAFLSALHMISKGGQVVILAPTEVLANQHFEKLLPLCEKLGVRAELLISAIASRKKLDIKQRIASQDVDLVIATHAVLQKDVLFGNLKLVVFDEQHKFGVMQRQQLLEKGDYVNHIMMSATPIPRTLSLVTYADMDISILKDKPQGRQAVQTISLSEKKIKELLPKLSQFIERDEKIFWLCPLVEENDELDLTDVKSRFASLNTLYPGDVGLIHGKMSASDKDHEMRDLLDGKIHILVATTVIEVGVDVPDATLMVVEHSERYGLSQLHQLRGRIGRANLPGTCILLHRSRLGEVAAQRITVMKESTDGFYIADQDLKLRGEGDLAGLRQSGLPAFRFFDPLEDDKILQDALSCVDNITSEQYGQFDDLIKVYKQDH